MMELRHYAHGGVTFDRERTYEQERNRGTYTKPVGFWVSVLGEDDWATWCASESFHTDALEFEHVVTLADGANILLLETPEALDSFTEEYGVRTSRSIPGHSWVDIHIDWPKVIERYDGIIIAPYQWSRRLDLNWYYGWDVASGCIWNPAAIASLELTNERTEA